jgi:hypothetical protein
MQLNVMVLMSALRAQRREYRSLSGVLRISTGLLLASSVACGGVRGGSPISPTPTQPTFTMSGSVQDGSNRLTGTIVQVFDGTNGGRSTITDGAGNYSLTNLQPGVFSVRFSMMGYDNVTRAVALAQDLRLEITLVRSAESPSPSPSRTPANEVSSTSDRVGCTAGREAVCP